MITVSGDREETQSLGDFSLTCPACRAAVPHRLSRRYTVAHLDFVPLYVTSSVCDAACSACGAVRREPAAPASAPPPPIRHRFGFALVMVPLAFVLGLGVPAIIADAPAVTWIARGLGALLLLGCAALAVVHARGPRPPREPARHAPLLKRPFGVLNALGVLAGIGFITFAPGAFGRELRHLPGAPWQRTVSFVCLGLAATAAVVELLRRRIKDRVTDILAFLYPHLRVYETGGIHLALGGTMGDEGGLIAGRMTLYLQNCTLGRKRVAVRIRPAGGCAFAGGGELVFDVHLAPAEVRAVFARRALTARADRAVFDLRARVRTQTLGLRVRHRMGYGLSTLDPTLVNAAALASGHLTIHSGRVQMAAAPPGTLVWRDDPAPIPVPPGKADADVPLWTRDRGWTTDPALREWLSAMSEPFRATCSPACPPSSSATK